MCLELIKNKIMYLDVRNMSEEERQKRKRLLKMKEFSFDSDLKKTQRQSETLEVERKDLKRKIDRMQVEMSNLASQRKKKETDIIFFEGELKKIKKQLIELR